MKETINAAKDYIYHLIRKTGLITPRIMRRAEERPHPPVAYHWLYLLTAFLILFVVALSWGIYTFLTIQDSIAEKTEPSAVETKELNQEQLAQILSFFKRRESEFHDLQSTPPPIPRPVSFGSAGQEKKTGETTTDESAEEE